MFRDERHLARQIASNIKSNSYLSVKDVILGDAMSKMGFEDVRARWNHLTYGVPITDIYTPYSARERKLYSVIYNRIIIYEFVYIDIRMLKSMGSPRRRHGKAARASDFAKRVSFRTQKMESDRMRSIAELQEITGIKNLPQLPVSTKEPEYNVYGNIRCHSWISRFDNLNDNVDVVNLFDDVVN